ncbi:DUF58 domain-containing protein [Candidatus Poribacteria bacterium]|nr:DUF58 domain-containing protein [Candidatus Poribacteria bacterium]
MATHREPAISPEVFANVRRIEMVALRLVTHLFTGEYSSVFKGQGIEFAEVRPYEPGDDIRSIDWNVTARMGQAYIKRYVEERESVLILIVDASGSLQVGSHRLKSSLAAEISAVLALAAIQNNDKVGLILFTDRVEQYVPPRKGRRHVLRVVREILTHRPTERGTNLEAALDFFSRVTRRRSTAFILSDFHASGYDHALRVAAKRHDVVALEIRDPLERELPDVGLVRWVDAETGAIQVAPSGRAVRDQDVARRELFRQLRVDTVSVLTSEPYIEPLLGFFRRRELRRRPG